MSALPQKIVFVITDLLLGGTPLILGALAEQLPLHNIHPAIVSLKPFPQKSLSAFDHSSFDFDSSFVLRPSLSPISIHSLNIHSGKDFPRAIRTLAKFLNQLRPDYFFSMLIHANLLATLTMPFLQPRPFFFQSLQTLQEKPTWHWTLQGILSPFADALVVPSQPIIDKISTYGNFKKAIVIPNGIDINRFSTASPLENTPWPLDSIVLGYVGRFDPVKNLPLLLQTFARLLDLHPALPLHLALVGYGPEEENLKNLSTSLHLDSRIHFPGPTQTPERFYKSFSAHVLPSSIEGFGLTLVEAMAAGIPVIAPDTAVTRAILRPNIDGFLFAPNSESSLLLALQSLINRLQNPSIPVPPVPTSLAHAEAQFSAPIMVRKYAAFFENFRT